jgi:TolB protein
MKIKLVTSVIAAALAGLAALLAQQTDVKIELTSGERPVIAMPDFRGSGEAQGLMAAFNATVFSDLQDSGYFRMGAKSMYPLEVPQRPEEFRPPAGTPPQRQGPWLTDWSDPPLGASYLGIGYTAIQNDRLVLLAWFYNVNQRDLTNAQVFGNRYFGTADEAGARKVAHEYAADILAKFGAQSLAGTKIYFTSGRSGGKEIWVMDHDGSNQRQLTRTGYASFAHLSPDGSRLAFMIFDPKNMPLIRMMSTETGRFLPFYNQNASVNSVPHFAPDGKNVLLASTAAGGPTQIYRCNLDGTDLKRITFSSAVDTEPKVNPKTGNEIVFTSGRSGPAQIYKMGVDGTNAVRLTTGEGDAGNPAWHPNGQHIAFKWTKGYDPGNYNIFIMDVATGRYTQLTHGAGRNENPTWAPGGQRLAFSSNRSGAMQIWTMLADGTGLQQLTTQGRNENPVWSK